MSKWKTVGTNALESFNPINDIEDKKKRDEARRKARFRMFQITHALQKQVLIKPKYIEVKSAD